MLANPGFLWFLAPPLPSPHLPNHTPGALFLSDCGLGCAHASKCVCMCLACAASIPVGSGPTILFLTLAEMNGPCFQIPVPGIWASRTAYGSPFQSRTWSLCGSCFFPCCHSEFHLPQLDLAEQGNERQNCQSVNYQSKKSREAIQTS